jgi:anti-sigma regulatory factor (Ser/Thr protein kinase)
VVNSGPSDPEALCEHVVRMLLPHGASGDDVALLAMSHEPVAGPRLRLEVPADPDELVVIRRSMERWLATSDVDERDAYRVTLATNEACMNAIEHGFGGPATAFELDAELTGSEVAVVVRDSGQWRSPRAPGDGRGLPMMRALMDDVDITTGPDGTTVRLSRAVRRDPFA